MYLYGTRSAANLGSYRRPRALGVARRPRRLRGLGDMTSNYNAAITGNSPAGAAAAAQAGSEDISDSVMNFFSSIYSTGYEAWTGNVSPQQKAQLVAQEQAQLVQAGMDPAAASQQAESDVTTTLETFNGPGGAGVNWTGADPSQPGFTTAAAQAAASGVATALSPLSSIPTWVWWVVGGIGVFVAYKVVKDIL